jgi:hypothetical protein
MGNKLTLLNHIKLMGPDFLVGIAMGIAITLLLTLL